MNTFIPGQSYNAMQTMAHGALANGHCPLHYTGLIYVGVKTDEHGVTEHEFMFEGESRHFDDGFVNTGTSFDNTVIIVESAPK